MLVFSCLVLLTIFRTEWGGLVAWRLLLNAQAVADRAVLPCPAAVVGFWVWSQETRRRLSVWSLETRGYNRRWVCYSVPIVSWLLLFQVSALDRARTQR